MYEHLHDSFNDNEKIGYESLVEPAEEFLEAYREITAQDIYRWLWEGEFGMGRYENPLTLDSLTYDLRVARTNPHLRKQMVWENAGLGLKLLRINIVPYSDSGCPLKRLLALAERTHDIRSDILQFKSSWSFMKTLIVPGLKVTLDDLNSFENSIPFHMTPEVAWSDLYLNTYRIGYMIVPRNLFFQSFPEYKNEEDTLYYEDSEEE